MNRFKLVLIGLAAFIAVLVMCSCTANVEARSRGVQGYEIIEVYEHWGERIYKVKTPEKTYTIFCNYKGGSVILN